MVNDSILKEKILLALQREIRVEGSSTMRTRRQLTPSVASLLESAGLDTKIKRKQMNRALYSLKSEGLLTSLFIDPDSQTPHWHLSDAAKFAEKWSPSYCGSGSDYSSSDEELWAPRASVLARRRPERSLFVFCDLGTAADLLGDLRKLHKQCGSRGLSVKVVYFGTPTMITNSKLERSLNVVVTTSEGHGVVTAKILLDIGSFLAEHCSADSDTVFLAIVSKAKILQAAAAEIAPKLARVFCTNEWDVFTTNVANILETPAEKIR